MSRGWLLIRRVAERVALVFAGLVAGLLLVEAGLRAGALVTSRYYAVASPTSAAGRVRILSLGDSNTFGLYVGRIGAYPHLLESQWNARRDRRPIEVINAGYPGNTSWAVRDGLGDLLAAHQPEIVTVMVGMNDAWRKPESGDVVLADACIERAHAATAPRPEPSRAPWRLMRAFRLLESWLPAPPEDLFGDLKPRREAPDPAWASELLDNLRIVAACAKGNGTQVVFVTYPSAAHQYGIANDAMRVAAMREGVPVIDLAQRFGPRCARSTCDYLFPDQHPTRAGHAWAAELLLDALPAAVPALGPGAGTASRE